MSNAPQNKYVIPYSEWEFARLDQQSEIFTRVEGGILPEREDLLGVTHIFDAACGPGGWLIAAARLYPDITFLGGDIEPQFVTYARERIQRLALSNASFQQVDITERLPFDDASFDVYNARFIGGVLTVDQWPSFLQEAVRVVRPGGVIRITEGAVTESNSAAFNRLVIALARSFFRAHRNFLPNEEAPTQGIVPMVGSLLRQAGCKDITHRSFIIDYSHAAPNREITLQHLRVTFAPHTLGPLIIGTGIYSAEEYQMVYDQAMHDLASSQFAGIGHCVTIVGKVEK